MYGTWDDEFLKLKDSSIEYLELYALVGTVLNWIHCFKNKRVVLFCDNQPVVQMVNNTTSGCKNCMVLIRKLVMKSLYENVRIFARYIRSGDNKVSDFLSRQKFTEANLGCTIYCSAYGDCRHQQYVDRLMINSIAFNFRKQKEIPRLDVVTHNIKQHSMHYRET